MDDCGSLNSLELWRMKSEVHTVKYEIVKDFPTEMMFDDTTPCISLYQPTHRYSSGNRQDQTVFKNLIREIESIVKVKYANSNINSLLQAFYQIEEDKSFWNHTLDGLAVLANSDKCIVYRLHQQVQEQVVVSDSYDLKPLIRIFQTADKFQLLGLSRSEFCLYEGNRAGIEEIELEPETARTIEQVLGEQLTDSFRTVGSRGDGSGMNMYHGHGGKKDEIDKDTEKFFRYVDGFVLEHYSKLSRLPLILVALTEHHNLFKKISSNPFLMEEGIKGSCRSLTLEQLTEKAGALMEPIFLERAKKLVESYNNAKAKRQGSDNLRQIAKAAFENRVDTVLIEAFRLIPGKIESKTGKLVVKGMKGPENDMLDDLTEMVLKKKGEVMILPKELMPGDSGVAAIFRY